MNNVLRIRCQYKTAIGDKIMDYYNNFSQEKFNETILCHSGFENFVDIIYKKHNYSAPQKECKLLMDNKITIADNKNVLVGFSGGLDSAYFALYLKDCGYNVTLFHAKNLNKNYPKESQHAIDFATKNNIDIIVVDCIHCSKEFWIDNPIKNQLLLGYMVDYCMQHNISNVAFGSDRATDLQTAKIGLTITDSFEIYDAFMEGINKYVSGIKMLFIDNNMSKYDRLKWLLKNHKDCIPDIYSCITPHRFNEKLHNINKNKFGIDLMKSRCGSCFKCCMEYILLFELGVYNNENFLKHCYDVLAQSKNSHAKELFALKIPYETRRKNVLNYMS